MPDRAAREHAQAASVERLRCLDRPTDGLKLPKTKAEYAAKRGVAIDLCS